MVRDPVNNEAEGNQCLIRKKGKGEEMNMQLDEQRSRMQGIALTTITPFHEDGTVDEDGIYRLVDFFVENGLDRQNAFLVPLSTTGH
jgi:hypothetical protein